MNNAERLRLRAELPRYKLAQLAGVAPDVVKRLECGQSITTGSAMKIADALGVTLCELLKSRQRDKQMMTDASACDMNDLDKEGNDQ